MEHYAIHLRCSPLFSPPLHLSYGSKRFENTIARGSKFNLKFNHATLSFPQFTTSHQFTRSFRHANCMINNSFSVPNSKNIEGSENKILRGMSGVSLVLGCILGIFNFSSMMNSKYNMAYAFQPPKMIIAGGESSFDSLWKTINAEGVETNPKFDPHQASVDDKNMYAVYLRKCGKKDEVVNMVKELEKDYKKSKDDPDTELFLRRALIELLLIQENFDEARMLLDKEIDSMLIDNENDKHYSKLQINLREGSDDVGTPAVQPHTSRKTTIQRKPVKESESSKVSARLNHGARCGVTKGEVEQENKYANVSGTSVVVPSRRRRVPAVSTCRKKELIILDDDGEVVGKNEVREKPINMAKSYISFSSQQNDFIHLLEVMRVQGDESLVCAKLEIQATIILAKHEGLLVSLDLASFEFYRGSLIKVNYVEKIRKLLEIYHNVDTTNPEKQPIADIFLYKAIIHTKLKDKEAAKWWEAFAKTLPTDE